VPEQTLLALKLSPPSLLDYYYYDVIAFSSLLLLEIATIKPISISNFSKI